MKEADKLWEDFDKETISDFCGDDNSLTWEWLASNSRQAFQQSLRAMVEEEILRLEKEADTEKEDPETSHTIGQCINQCRQFLVWIDECKPEKV